MGRRTARQVSIPASSARSCCSACGTNQAATHPPRPGWLPLRACCTCPETRGPALQSLHLRGNRAFSHPGYDSPGESNPLTWPFEVSICDRTHGKDCPICPIVWDVVYGHHDGFVAIEFRGRRGEPKATGRGPPSLITRSWKLPTDVGLELDCPATDGAGTLWGNIRARKNCTHVTRAPTRGSNSRVNIWDFVD